jgi:hypothetical protein
VSFLEIEVILNQKKNGILMGKKKSEKLPSCFTLDFNLEYIDLIRFKSFPVTPYLASFNHSLK